MTLMPNDDDRLWREEEAHGWFRFSTPLRYLVVLLILIALVVGGWYLLTPARQNYHPENLALIQADQAPYKVKAEDQTIPSIKHQDKLVYGRIRDDHTAPPVEHILPDPEPLLINTPTETPAVRMENLYAPDDIELEKKPEEEVSTVSSIEELIEDLPEETPSLPQTGQQNALIQLGSLKNHDDAQGEWERLSKKHKDVLKGRDPIIQKVDLGAEKGIFYRLRTSVGSAEEARQVCSTLKERKVDCLVIH